MKEECTGRDSKAEKPPGEVIREPRASLNAVGLKPTTAVLCIGQRNRENPKELSYVSTEAQLGSVQSRTETRVKRKRPGFGDNKLSERLEV